MATEIALLRLKASTTLSPPSPASTIWSESMTTVLSQPGAQRAYYGTSIESPSMLRLFIDWDSVEAHKTFMASDAYGPFVEKLMGILEGVEGLYHAEMKPFPPSKSLGGAPATELLTVFFPGEYSEKQMGKFSADVEELVSKIAGAGSGSGFVAASSGWVVEGEVADVANKEMKGRAYFAAIGWESVQAHLDFRGTDVFKENIHLLRGAEGLLGVHVEHYNGVEVGGSEVREWRGW